MQENGLEQVYMPARLRVCVLLVKALLIVSLLT